MIYKYLPNENQLCQKRFTTYLISTVVSYEISFLFVYKLVIMANIQSCKSFTHTFFFLIIFEFNSFHKRIKPVFTTMFTSFVFLWIMHLLQRRSYADGLVIVEYEKFLPATTYLSSHFPPNNLS